MTRDRPVISGDFKVKSVHGTTVTLVRWRWWHTVGGWAWRCWFALRRHRPDDGTEERSGDG